MSIGKKNAQKKNKGTLDISKVPFCMWRDKMKNLQECAKLYETLMNKNYIFTLENGIKFKIFFKPGNFYHLLGLHKIKDVQQLKDISREKVYKDILDGTLESSVIESSVFYYKIADRIKYFEKITDMLDKEKSKIIIDFDCELVDGSELEFTKYILYRHLKSGYANLTIGEKQGRVYPETYFFEDSKRYISEQFLLDIVNIEIKPLKKK